MCEDGCWVVRGGGRGGEGGGGGDGEGDCCLLIGWMYVARARGRHKLKEVATKELEATRADCAAVAIRLSARWSDQNSVVLILRVG